jgi:hypothetical protein
MRRYWVMGLRACCDGAILHGILGNYTGPHDER